MPRPQKKKPTTTIKKEGKIPVQKTTATASKKKQTRKTTMTFHNDAHSFVGSCSILNQSIMKFGGIIGSQGIHQIQAVSSAPRTWSISSGGGGYVHPHKIRASLDIKKMKDGSMVVVSSIISTTLNYHRKKIKSTSTTTKSIIAQFQAEVDVVCIQPSIPVNLKKICVDRRRAKAVINGKEMSIKQAKAQGHIPKNPSFNKRGAVEAQVGEQIIYIS